MTNPDNTTGPPDRDDGGRFTEQYRDDDFLDALDAEGGRAGTRAVANHVGCSYEAALLRLKDLDASGTIQSRDIGHARLWERGDD
jgi:hypothetical protein